METDIYNIYSFVQHAIYNFEYHKYSTVYNYHD